MSSIINETHLSSGQLCNILAALIAIMFFYAASSKLLHFKTTKKEMMKQVFPKFIALQLAWIVPITELIVTSLLMITSTQLLGFYAAAILMTFFSIYISVTTTGIFGDIPCSCAGILKNMSYNWHLVFNLFFLLLAVAGINIQSDWIFE